MTAPEQFNEEVRKEIKEHFRMPIIYGKPVTLFQVSDIEKFITQKLTAHKELILKMVREKAPSKISIGQETLCEMCGGYTKSDECSCNRRNEMIEEFLNNLDTL